MGAAEIARHPAPALHGGEHGLDPLAAARPVERLDRRAFSCPLDQDAVGLLELADRLGQFGVVFGVGLGGEVEAFAQQRHAGVPSRFPGRGCRGCSAARRRSAMRLPAGLSGCIAYLGELGLQRPIGWLRRIELLQCLRKVVGGRDFLQHVVGIERELVVDVRADAEKCTRPVIAWRA